ncbi:MAG: SapC family protein [Thermodesulfobacteriota bacterium]|nr:SapC family protein [Thermodesulfobacteriota bacterium]
MANIVPVSAKQHGDKTLLPLSSFAFAKEQNLIPAVATEFAQLAENFPIVFVEHEGTFNVFALCGLKNGENIFVNGEGKWMADYVPATLRRYPFVFARTDATEEEQYVLCIDEDSNMLADKGGVKLFNAAGENEPALDKALEFVTNYQKSAQLSQRLCSLLSENDLLRPLDLQLKGKDDKIVKIAGLHSVDEVKLNKLSEKAFLSLRKSGALPLIYAHLFSLGKIKKLANAVPSQNKKGTAKKTGSLPNRFSF